MRQKVVVTSALLHRPPVVLLDEPFTGARPAAERHADLVQRRARTG